MSTSGGDEGTHNNDKKKSKVDEETERLLTQLLLQRGEALAASAEEQGVLAFCRQPVVRERLNERFLQQTLRNVYSANRRSDEATLWELREAQREREARESARRSGRSPHPQREKHDNAPPPSSHSASPAEALPGNDSRASPHPTASPGSRRGGRARGDDSSDTASSASDGAERLHSAGPLQHHGSPAGSRSLGGGGDSEGKSEEVVDRQGDEGWIMSDREMEELLGRGVTKGRGSVGPQADMAGPYQPSGYHSARPGLEGVARGPAVPPWLAATRGGMGGMGGTSPSPPPPDPAVSARQMLARDPALARLLRKVAKRKLEEEQEEREGSVDVEQKAGSGKRKRRKSKKERRSKDREERKDAKRKKGKRRSRGEASSKKRSRSHDEPSRARERTRGSHSTRGSSSPPDTSPTSSGQSGSTSSTHST